MTSQPRKRGGQSKPAADQKPAEEAKAPAAEAPADEQPAAVEAPEEEAAQEAATEQSDEQDTATEQGDNADADETVDEPAGQAAYTDTLYVAGDPVPDQVAQGMVRPETGLSPPPAEDGPSSATAAFGDNERNGSPTGIPIDTSGELRHREGAVATAAYGQDAANGHVTGMDAEGQLNRDFGRNERPAAQLQGDGVRGEVGNGTGTPVGPDERPTYPSTTLTRSSSSAAPMEPDDVKLATQPKLGDTKTSTDPTMAAAAMPSMPGDETIELVNQKGQEVKPSEFFEVPDGVQGRTFRRVKHRVSEVFTVRKTETPGRRLLFTEGQMVPVDVAETLIRLHG